MRDFQNWHLRYQPVGKRSRGHPKRDGETNSWKRVQEYGINKACQQFREKKKMLSYDVSAYCTVILRLLSDIFKMYEYCCW
jgi:hypothetical protein